jgi:hypothetical protein
MQLMQTASSLEIKKDVHLELVTAVADAISLVQMYEHLDIPNINRKRRNRLASVLRSTSGMKNNVRRCVPSYSRFYLTSQTD